MNRREKLEALLKDDPDDSFLRYALAMQCVSEGIVAEGAARLETLLEQDPHYVAAYFQLAQLLAQGGAGERAKEILRLGIHAASVAKDDHAEGEMRGFLQQLEGEPPDA